MLTPGIEYFGAASDDEAAEFADGNARTLPPLVRLDAVAPDGAVAILGALLTSRSIEELSSAPALATLSVDNLEGSEVRLMRLPAETSAALVAADDGVLATAARRALIYFGSSDSADDITRALIDLANAARRGGGNLYCRVITSAGSESNHRVRTSRVPRVLPWLGVVAAAGCIVASVWVGHYIPSTHYAFLIAGAILGNLSAGFLFGRRRRRRIEAVAARSLGSLVVTIDASPQFLTATAGVVEEILGIPFPVGLPVSRGFHLSASPAGLELVTGVDDAILFPSARVLGITTIEIPSLRADLSYAGTIAALAIVLRLNDGESVVWTVPVITPDGRHPLPREVDQIGNLIAAVVGARSTAL